MKNLFASPKFLTIALAIIAVVAIPLTIIQVQNQQNIRQEASGSSYNTSQSASLVCSTGGFDISVKIKNTASTGGYGSPSVFTVTAKDSQTNQSVDLGTVQPGNTVTGVLHTSKTSMKSGKITFILAKPGSYSGSTTKSADYTAGSGGGSGYGYSSGSATCAPQVPPTSTPPPYSAPTPTPTPYPTGLPTPTPTVVPTSNPTLGPVKNVHIDCPNCVKQY